jgi:hypothetical protein
MPAKSFPGENGRCGKTWYFPETTSTSGKLMPAAFMPTRIWLALGERSGISLH